MKDEICRNAHSGTRLIIQHCSPLLRNTRRMRFPNNASSRPKLATPTDYCPYINHLPTFIPKLSGQKRMPSICKKCTSTPRQIFAILCSNIITPACLVSLICEKDIFAKFWLLDLVLKPIIKPTCHYLTS